MLLGYFSDGGEKELHSKAILLENDDIQLYYIEPLWVVDFNKTRFKFNIWKCIEWILNVKVWIVYSIRVRQKRKNNFVWLDNVCYLAVSVATIHFYLIKYLASLLKCNQTRILQFYKVLCEVSIIIKSNNVDGSNIFNRFNNENINLLILFVLYAQNKCYNCLSNCSLQQSAFVKRYFISLLNNFSPNCIWFLHFNNTQ